MSYIKTGLGITREVSGLGWTELAPYFSLQPADQSRKTGFVCSQSPYGYWGRQVCFIENDPLEQATAQRSGCVRARRSALTGSGILDCRTSQGNAGKVWCCPDNAPRPIPTTPEQRERDTELLLAEQRAREEGRLPETPEPTAEPTKQQPITSGQTEPLSQQEIFASTLQKINAHPEWAIGALAIGAIGVAGFFGYRYFKRLYGRMNLYSGVR